MKGLVSDLVGGLFGESRSRDTSLVLIHILEASELAFKIPDPFVKKFDILVSDSERIRIQVNEDFANYILNLYKERVQRAIQRQRFPVEYSPLSPRYVALKRKKGWYRGFWKATGYLQRNLKAWQDYGEYNIGFKRYQIHPIHRKSYLSICVALEYGNPQLGIPARPLFTPIAKRIESELPELFVEFLIKHFIIYRKYMIREEKTGLLNVF